MAVVIVVTVVSAVAFNVAITKSRGSYIFQLLTKADAKHCCDVAESAWLWRIFEDHQSEKAVRKFKNISVAK